MPEENIIFVLAHQDDEMGIYPEIERQSKKLGNNVIVYYLTNGVRQGHSSLERNEEAIKVLSTIGVDSENIHFLGDDLSISDQTLHENVVEVFSYLRYRIENGPLPELHAAGPRDAAIDRWWVVVGRRLVVVGPGG